MQSGHAEREPAPRPNLFVVGAMKAGTSSLHAVLKQHPQVFMSEPKEPAYFIEPGRRPRDLYGDSDTEDQCLATYLNLFAAARNHTYVGESSTHYAKLPTLNGVVDRIHAFNRNARIIYLVRDPVERTISHYWWNCRFHAEVRSPLDAILGNPEYLAFSHYAMQMRAYLESFSPEQIWLMTFEELCAAPDEQMGKLYEWLGLGASVVRTSEFARENATPGTIVQQRVRALAQLRESRLYASVSTIIPKQLRTMARAANELEVDRKSVSFQELIAHLRGVQKEQVAELEAMFGRTFPCWRTLYGV
jgi:Sulfotransferase family